MRHNFFLATTALLFAFPAHGATEHQVIIENAQFVPRDIIIQAGDSVTWTNKDTLALYHNVRANNGTFRCAQGCDGMGGNGDPSNGEWSFTLTFNQLGVINYACEPHAIVGMTGTVTVLSDDDPGPGPDPDPGVAINFGMTGSWYNDETNGQGALVDVVIGRNPPEVVVYMFTYDLIAGGPEAQRWFILQGSFQPPSDTVELAVILATGGAFDQADPPFDFEIIGSAELKFLSCGSAVLTYDIDFDGDAMRNVSGVIPLQRLSPDVLCEELSQ